MSTVLPACAFRHCTCIDGADLRDHIGQGWQFCVFLFSLKCLSKTIYSRYSHPGKLHIQSLVSMKLAKRWSIAIALRRFWPMIFRNGGGKMLFISLEFGQVNKIIHGSWDRKNAKVGKTERWKCVEIVRIRQAETSTASDHGQLRTKVPSISFFRLSLHGFRLFLFESIWKQSWKSWMQKNMHMVELRLSVSLVHLHRPTAQATGRQRSWRCTPPKLNKEAKKQRISFCSFCPIPYLDLDSVICEACGCSPVSKYISKSYSKLRVVSVLFLETPKGWSSLLVDGQVVAACIYEIAALDRLRSKAQVRDGYATCTNVQLFQLSQPRFSKSTSSTGIAAKLNSRCIIDMILSNHLPDFKASYLKYPCAYSCVFLSERLNQFWHSFAQMCPL